MPFCDDWGMRYAMVGYEPLWAMVVENIKRQTTYAALICESHGECITRFKKNKNKSDVFSKYNQMLWFLLKIVLKIASILREYITAFVIILVI